MKYFVTGATGYVGAHLVKKLSEAGHRVNALVRSRSRGENILYPDVELFEGTLMDTEVLQEAASGCDGIFHVAAFARVWAADPSAYFDINVRGTVNVIEAALKAGSGRIVFTSSAGVFGPSFEDVVTEETVRRIDFFNEYESSKAMAESRLRDYIIKGLDAVIVSPTRIYGPFLFGEPASVTLLADKYINGAGAIIPGKGDKTGNYVYIDDVVEGHIAAMEKGEKGELYILGGENHDYNSFFTILKEVSGVSKPMFRFPFFLSSVFASLQLFLAETAGKEPLMVPRWLGKGKYNWTVDSSRSVSGLGISVTSLKDGLGKTAEWLRSR